MGKKKPSSKIFKLNDYPAPPLDNTRASRISYSTLYSSFLITQNMLLHPTSITLFREAVGGQQTGEEWDKVNEVQTDMFTSGLIPLGRSYNICSIEVTCNRSITPGLLHFLSYSTLKFRSPTSEENLGTLAMSTREKPFYASLEAGMDFSLKVEFDDKACKDLLKEWNPWYMKFIPKSMRHKRSVRCWVVLKGTESRSI